jgi:hypothetical protein
MAELYVTIWSPVKVQVLQGASPWRLASVRNADLGRISYPEDYHPQ